MSDWAEQPAAPAAGTTPGAALAAQREAMGWTVEQVAEQLKLAVRQVVALEAGDYAALPGPAVVRGFIRAYAKVVKLDAAPLVAMVPLDEPEAGDATATTVRRERPATFSEVRFPTHGKKTRLPLGWIAVAGVLVAGAALAWHFQLVPMHLLRGDAPASATAAGPQASVTVLPAPATVAAPLQAPAAPPPQVVLPSTSVPLISVPPQQTMAAPDSPGAAAVPAAAPAPAAAAPSGNALVLNVTADSWVEVRRAKGAPLLSKMLRAGSSETVEINEPVTLVVGKPAGVAATLRGAALELPPTPGSTISRVSIK